MSYKIIAFMGKAGSGKDTIMQNVIQKNSSLHEIISCTTRPRREHEREGVNYFYLTPEQFGDKVLHGEMLEATCFNDWFYGTSYDSLRSDCINVGVFNPAGIEAILSHEDIDAKVYYVQSSGKQRLLRQLNRETDPDVDEIIRRYRADELDFDDLSEIPYAVLINENFEDLAQCVDKVLDEIR